MALGSDDISNVVVPEGFSEIPFWRFWNMIGPVLRVALLETSRAVDLITETYLELADVLEVYPGVWFDKLPGPLRAGLEKEFMIWMNEGLGLGGGVVVALRGVPPVPGRPFRADFKHGPSGYDKPFERWGKGE